MTTVVTPGHRKAWTYTDDLGHVWRFAVKAVYVPPVQNRGLLGGSAASPTIPALPAGYRMRAVLAHPRTGTGDIWIAVYSPTAAFWLNPTSLTRTKNGQDMTYDGDAKIRRQETRPRDQTRQQA